MFEIMVTAKLWEYCQVTLIFRVFKYLPTQNFVCKASTTDYYSVVYQVIVDS